MNEMITSKVTEFAKANRVNKTKLMDLVMSLVPESKPTRKNGKSVDEFEKIITHAKENNGVIVVASLRALKITSDPNYVTSVMVKKGLIVKSTPMKVTSGRGRPSKAFTLV